MEELKNIDRDINQLKEKYRTKLSQNLETLCGLRRNPSLANFQDTSFSELKNISHQLKGSAKTFGYNAIGKKAENLDKHLSHIFNSENNFEHHDNVEMLFEKLNGLIHEIKYIIARESYDTTTLNDFNEKESHSSLPANQFQSIVLLITRQEKQKKAFLRTLREEDYLVLIAETEAQAIQQSKTLGVNQIIIDTESCDIDPHYLIEQLGDDDQLINIPVMTLSEYETITRKDGYAVATSALPSLIKKNKAIIMKERNRILLADDDEMITSLLSYVLRNAGHDVIICKDGKDALEKAQKYKPDLAILDCVMPKLDGFAVLKGIKGEESTSEIPVIMLSALTRQSTIAKGVELGIKDYVCKPFQTEDLIERIENNLLDE